MKINNNFEFFLAVLTDNHRMIFYIWLAPDPFTKLLTFQFGMFGKMFISWTAKKK